MTLSCNNDTMYIGLQHFKLHCNLEYYQTVSRYSKLINIFIAYTFCSILFDIIYCKALCKSVTNKYYYYYYLLFR